MSSQVQHGNGISFIVGPSHAVRWSWHIRDGVVHSNLPSNRVWGVGGAPVWSKRLFERAGQVVAEGGKVGVMVGDFRFGNDIALTPEDLAGPLFQDGHLGIDSRAMTPELDHRMLERGLAAVQAWQEAFGDRVRFVFWDLFGRQVHDRLAGQHIGGGRYHHPVFNYADVVGRFPGADIVDLSPLLGAPMHEVRRLFIDSSCHPSQIGYLLLNDALCAGRDPIEAFRSAVANVEAELFALAGKIVGAKGGAVLLTGRSVWLDTLMSYMGKDCALRLAGSGLVLAPLTRLPGQPSIAQMLQQVPLDRCVPVLVSAGAQDLSPQLARAFDTDPSFWRDVPCIDWETATVAAITARRETPRHAYAREDAPKASVRITPELAAHMVEQGPLGMPSWTGLRHLAECIASDQVPALRRGTEAGRPQHLPT